MTALGQGGAGVALVMCFALLRTRQISAASILMAVQCLAVAIGAAALHRPLLAIAPALIGIGVWLLPRHASLSHAPSAHAFLAHTQTDPVGGAKLGIAVGAVLAILCQSQGTLALPLTVVLLSVLLAATRPHPLMRVMALAGVQNGLILAGSILVVPEAVPSPELMSLAGVFLPLPFAAALLAATMQPRTVRPHHWLNWTEADEAPEADQRQRAWINAGLLRMDSIKRAWLRMGWIDLALALGIFVATLIVPLHALAAVFAPLLGLDGVLRSYRRRNRHGIGWAGRGSSLLTSGLAVLAVCAPDPVTAWLGLVGAVAAALLPTLGRRPDQTILGFIGAGLALFGLLLLTAAPSILAYFSLFAGFATIAATVPDLAVVVVILLLQRADHGPWPPAAEAVGSGVGLAALLACVILLLHGRTDSVDPRAETPTGGATSTSVWTGHRATLLLLSQSSIAALSISIGQADGRFAALVLLVLLILSRSAARISTGSVAVLAMAGLGGIPPLGVFPGLVLVVLAMINEHAWLLIPLGAAAIPIVLTSLPHRVPEFSFRSVIPCIGWLPLLLAFLVGFFAPNGLVQWWHMLTAGQS